ncbi:hypothetical protein J6TS7_29630 [Paenibacillus dendritiformis]|uniref:hypothetical protein n=1 Tax=Paenibacillus TaxID=44249 RepID=UPI001B2F32D0|nr:hypothetical protein [Paenibacillus dendritiformis]GIO79353.1 hypothetical protein J6TS7_29630 [Paenibacillus dendritiformis]
MTKVYPLMMNEAEYEAFKNRVPKNNRGKVLKDYILHQYSPNLENVQAEGKCKQVSVRIDEMAIEKLDDYVNQLKTAGHDHLNRSALMRDVIRQLQTLPNKTERIQASYYFERGTRELLDQWFGHRERNFAIEEFILNDFRLPIGNLNALQARPDESEPIRINLSVPAVEKLDFYVKQIGIKGVTRTAIMREVVRQLLEKISRSNYKKLLLRQQIKSALHQYRLIAPAHEVKELIHEYLVEEKGKGGTVTDRS